jgi:hypothetical protein
MTNDRTVGRRIAERHLFEEEDIATLAKDIDSAVANAINLENEACALLAHSLIGPDGCMSFDGDDGLYQDGVNSAAKEIVQEIRNRRKQ